jgi:hypothetical protein
MKLIRAEGDQFEFELRAGEQARLRQVLGLYPLAPASHHRLSRGTLPRQEENQRLLEEAMQSHRTENRQWVESLLKAPERFVKSSRGYRTRFNRGELECLLQVCNDVRIGGWIALGSPEEPPELKQGMSAQTILHLATMDLAAYFEMCFLSAVSGEPPAEGQPAD